MQCLAVMQCLATNLLMGVWRRRWYNDELSWCLTKEESTAGSMPGMVVQKWKPGRDEWSARRTKWIVIPPTREDRCHLSQQSGFLSSRRRHTRWRDQELAVQW